MYCGKKYTKVGCWVGVNFVAEVGLGQIRAGLIEKLNFKLSKAWSSLDTFFFFNLKV